MKTIETDYLIVGSGAVGLAFADTLLDETDADIVIVDRHGKPGGHWNDAYSFVALHQPSAFYGVNSVSLGTNRKDEVGVNTGLYELASGPEVSGYFDSVVRQRFLPTGRVRYFPTCDYVGDGQFVSLLSGAETQVSVRNKTVDATYFGTSVPSTHTPKFTVGPGICLITPNALPQLWMDPAKTIGGERPRNFVIVGAGKTAMDVGVWLLASGAEPESIRWIMPRDSWLLNRLRTQPGLEFFDETIGGQAAQMAALAESSTVDEVFHRLEQTGVMMRIYPDVEPTMFHYATISAGEVDELRRITQVIRKGRVQTLSPTEIVLDHGIEPVVPGTVFIDCTASAVDVRPSIPIFQGSLITPQMVRVPQPAFSAALIAYVEAHYPDDEQKNALCATVPFPITLADFPACNLGNMMNQFAWMQDKTLSRWIRECRLDGFAKVVAAIDPDDTAKQEMLQRLRNSAFAAIGNMQKLSSLP